MDDLTFNAFKAITAGMDHQQREQMLEILRNPPTGRTPADLVQLLELKKSIDELTQLVTTYEERGWRDIDGNNPSQVSEFRDPYLKLHRRILDYFLRVSYGNFSITALDRYDSIQNRILLEGELAEKRKEIQRMWDFYHKVAALPDKIRKLPSFSLQRATDYGRALVLKKTDPFDKVTEDTMRSILETGDDSDPSYLHSKWFLAKLFIEQQPSVIEKATREVDAFERSFKKTTPDEVEDLTAFKTNQDPKYCTQNYQIAYNRWCLSRFKKLIGR